MLLFIARRLGLIPLQAIGVTIITFLLVRLIPGDPAQVMAGPFATPAVITSVRDRLGLNLPLWNQYGLYINRILHLDLGTSFTTGRPVRDEIFERLPATLELITVALVFCVIIGVSLGAFIAFSRGGFADRLTFVYGLLAGALPDFWVGLVLIYVFFYVLGWFPAPTGRLDPSYSIPRVTGFMLIDTLLSGNSAAFLSAAAHLALPVATLVFVYMGAILKMTRARLRDMLESDFVGYARALGLSNWDVLRYALRNALPPVVTITAVTYSFLLGGAVLVETIFSWGGLGQYAVQAVARSDYSALQGVILIAALFNLVVYLMADVVDRLIDPRIGAGGAT